MIFIVHRFQKVNGTNSHRYLSPLIQLHNLVQVIFCIDKFFEDWVEQLLAEHQAMELWVPSRGGQIDSKGCIDSHSRRVCFTQVSSAPTYSRSTESPNDTYHPIVLYFIRIYRVCVRCTYSDLRFIDHSRKAGKWPTHDTERNLLQIN